MLDLLRSIRNTFFIVAICTNWLKVHLGFRTSVKCVLGTEHMTAASLAEEIKDQRLCVSKQKFCYFACDECWKITRVVSLHSRWLYKCECYSFVCSVFIWNDNDKTTAHYRKWLLKSYCSHCATCNRSDHKFSIGSGGQVSAMKTSQNSLFGVLISSLTN